ncbi:NADP-dependent oxidoreductase [Kitasatospora sp. NPDC096147]|uniref:NADP-dependent oxidoreductase n=1 Tax=Kitasatospora sp. NPDC096147 TaxID=3364093 RepID=UPI00380AA040
MRAVVVREYGGPEQLRVEEVAPPEPGPGQLLIRMEAAGVHPVDAVTRAGVLAGAGLMAPREVTGIGWDVAGVVERLGPGAAGFAVGERVIGLRDRLDLPLGTHAELVVLDLDAVAPAPAGVPSVEAATLPLDGLTAGQALDLLDLPPGATLLVTGAAGGVGGLAVQLAVRRGLRVVAQGGAADEAPLRALGAEWFVARGAGELAQQVRESVPGGVDGALDAALLGVEALGAVRNRGAFAALSAGRAPLPLRGIRVAQVWVAADPGALARLSALAAGGALVLRAGPVLPLAEAAEAHRLLARPGRRGTPVLVP